MSYGKMGAVPALLTVGDGQQGAVRCVHVARSHVVPLRRPVDRGVVLNVKLLHRERPTAFSASLFRLGLHLFYIISCSVTDKTVALARWVKQDSIPENSHDNMPGMMDHTG